MLNAAGELLRRCSSSLAATMRRRGRLVPPSAMVLSLAVLVTRQPLQAHHDVVGLAPAGKVSTAAAKADAIPSAQPLARPVLLIGFGILLGWSASTMFAFYGADTRTIAAQGLAQSSPDRLLRSATFPSVSEEATVIAEAAPALPSGPAFALFGGNEPAGRDTLFCAVLVVDPGGCDAEESRRSTESLGGPAEHSRPKTGGATRNDGGKRLPARPTPARSRPMPVTTSSLARPKVPARDPIDP